MAFNKEDERRKAAYKYINEYQKQKYDRITILRKPGERERLTKLAREKGYRSMNEYINYCIDQQDEKAEKGHSYNNNNYSYK